MAHIVDHVTVTRDGFHNAFTDMVFWKGMYWIAYRKAYWHGFCEAGETVLAASAEPRRFREVARLKIPGDCRDPRFAILSQDRLAVLIPVVTAPAPGDTEHPLQQYVSFSNDGYAWEGCRSILPPRHHIFRLRRHEGLFYGLNVIREKGTSRLELAVSENLLAWERRAALGTTSEALNEADIHFRPDGEAWIIARTTRKPVDDAVFCRATPPYTQWEIIDLKTLIHAPAFLEHDGVVYVAGRCNPKRDGYGPWPFGSSLGLWAVTPGRVDLVLHVPAIGDCSYPALVKDPQGRILMSYYSQHAYYLGVLPPFAGQMPGGESAGTRTACAADIYLAQLQLP